MKRICILVSMVMTLSYAGPTKSEWINMLEIDTKNLYQSMNLPSDVTKLLEKIKECAYWVEEWQPQIEMERKLMIEEKINSICLEAMGQRNMLLKKYKDNPQVLEHLN